MKRNQNIDQNGNIQHKHTQKKSKSKRLYFKNYKSADKDKFQNQLIINKIIPHSEQFQNYHQVYSSFNHNQQDEGNQQKNKQFHQKNTQQKIDNFDKEFKLINKSDNNTKSKIQINMKNNYISTEKSKRRVIQALKVNSDTESSTKAMGLIQSVDLFLNQNPKKIQEKIKNPQAQLQINSKQKIRKQSIEKNMHRSNKMHEYLIKQSLFKSIHKLKSLRKIHEQQNKDFRKKLKSYEAKRLQKIHILERIQIEQQIKGLQIKYKKLKFQEAIKQQLKRKKTDN